jgi:hypothetical protein
MKAKTGQTLAVLIAVAILLNVSPCEAKVQQLCVDPGDSNPMLQSLGLNSPGTTETQALAEGSPALKAGNPAKPNGQDGHCLPTDQRGVTRPKGACDSGAFQLSD